MEQPPHHSTFDGLQPYQIQELLLAKVQECMLILGKNEADTISLCLSEGFDEDKVKSTVEYISDQILEAKRAKELQQFEVRQENWNQVVYSIASIVMGFFALQYIKNQGSVRYAQYYYVLAVAVIVGGVIGLVQGIKKYIKPSKNKVVPNK